MLMIVLVGDNHIRLSVVRHVVVIVVVVVIGT